MKKAIGLGLERLEGRLTPATVTVSGGVLCVSGQVGPLLVETATNNGSTLIRVQDGVTNQLVTQPLTQVSLTDSAGDDQITVRAAAAALPIDLAVLAGRGSDTVTFEGSVLGNLSFSGNAGNLTVLMESGPVSVGGNLTFTAGTGTHTFSIQNIPFSLAGNLVVNAAQSSSTTFALADTGATGSVMRVQGQTSYNGGAGNDLVMLGNVAMGNTTVALGDGTNMFGDNRLTTYTALSVTGGQNSIVRILGAVQPTGSIRRSSNR
jgi:hypothetical protein